MVHGGSFGTVLKVAKAIDLSMAQAERESQRREREKAKAIRTIEKKTSKVVPKKA